MKILSDFEGFWVRWIYHEGKVTQHLLSFDTSAHIERCTAKYGKYSTFTIKFHRLHKFVLGSLRKDFYPTQQFGEIKFRYAVTPLRHGVTSLLTTLNRKLLVNRSKLRQKKGNGSVNSKRALPPPPRTFVILFWKSCKCPTLGPGVYTKTPRWGFKIGCKCLTPGQHQNFIFQ